MITTTLKALLQHKPCVDGYNKLACHVTNNEYVASCETYVTHQHDKPINLLTILESNGLYDALWALRACEQTPELIQAARLYTVWCVLQVQQHIKDKRSIAALDVAERHAYGLATDVELSVAKRAAWSNIARDVTLNTASISASEAAYYAVEVGVNDAEKQMFIDVFCGESINIDSLKKK